MSPIKKKYTLNRIILQDRFELFSARALLGEKKWHKMKNEKNLLGFSYCKNMANFEVFCMNISPCINLFF